ncbi:MAG: hypothetical protein ACXAB7_16555 [Candidatus Kariarchaeaceae archaeon]|jgi:hypothetical protein
MTYEFSEEEGEVLWVFGNKLVIVSLLLGLSGILGFFAIIAELTEDNQVRSIVLITQFLFLVVSAVVLYRPSDNFTRIATSEGKDIQELMRGVDEFTFGFTIVAILMFVVGLLNYYLILDKI